MRSRLLTADFLLSDRKFKEGFAFKFPEKVGRIQKNEAISSSKIRRCSIFDNNYNFNIIFVARASRNVIFIQKFNLSLK